MLPQDALKKLKGTDIQKRELFDFFVEKAIASSLEEWEGAMLEALKKELIKPMAQVIQISASMKGAGSAGI